MINLDPHYPTPIGRNQYRISRTLSQCSLVTTPPATDRFMLPKLTSLWPFNFPYPLCKSDTDPNITRPTLLIVINRYLVISSCIRLLAFLASRKNSHNRTSLQAIGDAFTRKLVHFFVLLCVKVGLWTWCRQNLLRFRSK